MVTIRAFLINRLVNGRGWGTSTNIAKNVLSFLKRPLILKRYPDGRVDHREWNSSLSASDNLREQEDFAIGRIEKVLYDTEADGYYADINITNPHAAAWINTRKASKIPIRVSPQIIYDQRKESDLKDIKNWFGSHLAIVNAGAYGPDAVATNFCTAECPLDLRKGANASIGFDIMQALDASLFDTSLVESNDSNQYPQMAMIEVKPDASQSQQPANTQPGTLAPSIQKEVPYMRDVTNKSPVPTTEQQPAQTQQQEQKPTEQNIDYKQLFEQQKQELEAAKVKLAESQTVSERLTEHEKKIAKYEAEGKERAIREAIPIFLSEFLDKKGQVNNDAVDAKVKDIIKRGFTVDDVKYMFAPAVAAFEDSINTNTNKPATPHAQSANASNPNPIFEIPKIETQAANASLETPWFVTAAKLMSRNESFSKQPGRVL